MTLNGSCSHPDISRRYLGEDPEQGRFADVHLETCIACGAQWLHYQFEIEGFSRSGRWYRGRLTPELASSVSAAGAASVLESLPSYEAGGSYFGGEEQVRSGPLL